MISGGNIMSIIKHNLWYLFLTVLSLLSPALCYSEANVIYKENSGAIAVIITYDSKGNPTGQGSGFVVREDGGIVTNYHVVENAKKIDIKIGDKVYEAEGLLHQDIETDIVILKAKAEKLKTVKLGYISRLEVGEKIYVISSPHGLENTISEGIVSGIREIDSKRKILQITAPISAGSSGGAVFNQNGEVVGVATFILKESQNLNFAMPADIFRDEISNKKITSLRDAEFKAYKETAAFWFVYGNNLADNGQFQEAIEALKKAIRIKPDYADAYYNLGNTYSESGSYKEAIVAFKQAIQIKPDFADAYNNLGIAYGKADLIKEAIEVLKKAIRIKPDYAQAYFNLGIAYGKLDLHKEEIEVLKKAIRIKPDYAQAYNNLGVAYSKSELFKKAIEAWKQAIRIEPDDAKAHLALGLSYMILKEKGAALEESNILRKLNTEMADILSNIIAEEEKKKVEEQKDEQKFMEGLYEEQQKNETNHK
jgi:tetratricopeptide (TPR) repeat protein